MKKILWLISFVMISVLYGSFVSSEILKFGENNVVAYVIDQKPLTVQLKGTTYHILRTARSTWIINNEEIPEVMVGVPYSTRNRANFTYLGMQSKLYKIRIDAPSPCGNGICDNNESCLSCPSDCGECCKDSDGASVYSKGIVNAGKLTYTDDCKDMSSVNEYICDGGTARIEIISCPDDEKCDDGICIKQPIITGDVVMRQEPNNIWESFINAISRLFGK